MADTGYAFANVPFTARGHLGLLFYETALRTAFYVRRRAVAVGQDPDRALERLPFLASYVRRVSDRMPDAITWESSFRWLQDTVDEWERMADVWLPLKALRLQGGLSRVALLSFIATGLVEEDSGFAGLFASLQRPLDHRRPSMGLLRELLQAGDEDAADVWELAEPLVELGLVDVLNRDAPRSEWVLRVLDPVWSAARGDLAAEPVPGLRYHPRDSLAGLDDVTLDPNERQQLLELVLLLERQPQQTVIIRGTPGGERVEVLQALARAQGCGVLHVDGGVARDEDRLRLVGPLCTMMNAVPVFAMDLDPGETRPIPALPSCRGLVGVALGRDGGLSGERASGAVTIRLGAQPMAQRVRLWRQALSGLEDAEIEEIASRFVLPSRYILQSANLAVSYAALAGRRRVTTGDVREATRTVNRQLLDSLADRLDDTGRWTDLVVHRQTERELHDLEQRCRQRERLAEMLDDSLPGGVESGVRVLFEGPSGTGKTLAARVLAGSLGLDLYRVDLASVVNKYIGETEKNLGRVLGRAEELNVILLLDEGDALMGRRTDIRTANDRYANLETNYLLQRLETYTGIVIVTTNAGGQIDVGFRRRIDVAVTFYLPDPEERFRLWQLHLPGHAVPWEELERIAVRYELSGGQIRNAALQATLAALDRGETAARLGDLRTAIQTEFRKSGASCRVDEPLVSTHDDPSMVAFFNAIS